MVFLSRNPLQCQTQVLRCIYKVKRTKGNTMNLTSQRDVSLLASLCLNKKFSGCKGACALCMTGKADPSDKCAKFIDSTLGVK